MPKNPVGRPKTQFKPIFKIERTSFIKPPLKAKRITIKEALDLINDPYYYEEIMEAKLADFNYQKALKAKKKADRPQIYSESESD